MVLTILVIYAITFFFLISGVIMKNHYSKFPDTSVGFHLSYAVKDKETWDKANQYAGKLCIRSAICVLALDFVLTVCCIFIKSAPLRLDWDVFLIVYIFAALIVQMILLCVLPYRHLKKK